MASFEIEPLWAQPLRHLAASRFYLPEHLPSGTLKEAEAEFLSYLHHNELELALDVAEDMGREAGAPPEFWNELYHAALAMSLVERAAALGKMAGT